MEENLRIKSYSTKNIILSTSITKYMYSTLNPSREIDNYVLYFDFQLRVA